MMMGESGKIDWENMRDALPAFLTIVLMPLTYSITNGMVFGLLSAAGFYFTSGQFLRAFAGSDGSSEGVAPVAAEEESIILSPAENATRSTHLGFPFTDVSRVFVPMPPKTATKIAQLGFRSTEASEPHPG